MLVYPLYSGLCPGRSIFWANREAGRGQGLPQGERGGPDLDGLFSFAQLRLSEDFACSKKTMVCICADLEKRDKGWGLDVCGHIGGKEEKMERLGEGRTSVGRRGVVRKAGRQECRHFTMELRSVCTPSSQRKLLEIQTLKNGCWRPGSLILSIRQTFSIDLPSYYGSESNVRWGERYLVSNQQTHVPALSSTLPASSAGCWLPLYEYFFWKLLWKLLWKCAQLWWVFTCGVYWLKCHPVGLKEYQYWISSFKDTWEPERVPTGSDPSRTPATNNFPMKRECWFCRDWD